MIYAKYNFKESPSTSRLVKFRNICFPYKRKSAFWTSRRYVRSSLKPDVQNIPFTLAMSSRVNPLLFFPFHWLNFLLDSHLTNQIPEPLKFDSS